MKEMELNNVLQQYMTIAEAAEEWGLSRQSVYVHIREKDIPYTKVGTTKLIRKDTPRPVTRPRYAKEPSLTNPLRGLTEEEIRRYCAEVGYILRKRKVNS